MNPDGTQTRNITQGSGGQPSPDIEDLAALTLNYEQFAMGMIDHDSKIVVVSNDQKQSDTVQTKQTHLLGTNINLKLNSQSDILDVRTDSENKNRQVWTIADVPSQLEKEPKTYWLDDSKTPTSFMRRDISRTIQRGSLNGKISGSRTPNSINKVLGIKTWRNASNKTTVTAPTPMATEFTQDPFSPHQFTLTKGQAQELHRKRSWMKSQGVKPKHRMAVSQVRPNTSYLAKNRVKQQKTTKNQPDFVKKSNTQAIIVAGTVDVTPRF